MLQMFSEIKKTIAGLLKASITFSIMIIGGLVMMPFILLLGKEKILELCEALAAFLSPILVIPINMIMHPLSFIIFCFAACNREVRDACDLDEAIFLQEGFEFQNKTIPLKTYSDWWKVTKQIAQGKSFREIS